MLPKSLYELIPFLYVVLGVVVALVLYNSYAIISGILLLTVALMILHMRLKSRTKAMERFERLYAQKKRREEEYFLSNPIFYKPVWCKTFLHWIQSETWEITRFCQSGSRYKAGTRVATGRAGRHHARVPACHRLGPQ